MINSATAAAPEPQHLSANLKILKLLSTHAVEMVCIFSWG